MSDSVIRALESRVSKVSQQNRWTGDVRKASSNHVWESICDTPAILLNLVHVGIHMFGCGRLIEGNLWVLVVVFRCRESQLEKECPGGGEVYNVFCSHIVGGKFTK